MVQPQIRIFAAESRITLLGPRDWPLLRSMLAAAGDRIADEGPSVRWLSGTYLPDEGRLLNLFAAPSAEVVRRVLLAAGVSAVWITPAVALGDLDRAIDAS